MRAWRVIVAGVAVVALGAGCSGDDETSNVPDGGEIGSACEAEPDERPARALLRCAEPSLAFVETLFATGTGIVVEAGDARYVVTNHHVVEPFDRADVVVDGTEIPSLPLVGADVSADIALLGPLDADLPALSLSPGDDLERGDDVYLIGYPGESASDDHEATISSGIVSRRREAKEWDQVYIQSDASIAGGQSGGPLFDERGRLVGVSGLGFADEFALVLSGKDVQQAIERIVADGGDDVLTVPARVPAEGGATSGITRVSHARDYQALFLPPGDEARTWTLHVADADSTVSVFLSDVASGEPIAVTATSFALVSELRALFEARGLPTGDLPQPDEIAPFVTDAMRAREVTPGTFTVEVAADQGVEVLINVPLTDGPVDVEWESDQDLWMGSLPVETRSLALGDTSDGLLNAFDTSVDFLVELGAGQVVEVWARSPQGDMGVTVVPPGVMLDAVAAYAPELAGLTEFDDSDEGLYGLDVRETFTASDAGVYRFVVYILDLSPTAFRFSVAPSG